MGKELPTVINSSSPLFWAPITAPTDAGASFPNTNGFSTLGSSPYAYDVDAGNWRGPACRRGLYSNYATLFASSVGQHITWRDTGGTLLAPIDMTSTVRDPMSIGIMFYVDDWPTSGTQQCLWAFRSDATISRHLNMRIQRDGTTTKLRHRFFNNNTDTTVEWCRRRWNQVVLTHDPATPTTRLYVNGEDVTGIAGIGQWGGSEYRVSVGRDCLGDFDGGASPDNYFDGFLANFTIWHSELSADDVAEQWLAVCRRCRGPLDHVDGPYQGITVRHVG